MNDPCLMIYVTESCPFCEEFLKSQAPGLFMWLVENTIPYELVEASNEYLKNLGVIAVPCLIYNGAIIDPQMIKFTKDNIIRTLSTPKAPTFSGIPRAT